MGKTILCQHCKSTFNEDLLKDREQPDLCPVCGKSLVEDGEASPPPPEKKKWYYYKEGGGGLDDTLSSRFVPLYTFEAVDLEDAKRQLKEVLPNCPLLRKKSPAKVRCPRCGSSEIQLVPRKYGLMTGFATSKCDRMCLRCMKKF